MIKMTIDLDAITRVLAPSIVGNSFDSNNSTSDNSFNAGINSAANIVHAAKNPDSDAQHDGDDSGSPDSETEEAAENNAMVSVQSSAPEEANSNIKETKEETANKKFIRKQYIDPITKEYTAEFNNFRGRPTHEDDIYDKFKF